MEWGEMVMGWGCRWSGRGVELWKRVEGKKKGGEGEVGGELVVGVGEEVEGGEGGGVGVELGEEVGEG